MFKMQTLNCLILKFSTQNLLLSVSYNEVSYIAEVVYMCSAYCITYRNVDPPPFRDITSNFGLPAENIMLARLALTRYSAKLSVYCF